MTPHDVVAELVAWLREKKATDDEVREKVQLVEADLDGWGSELDAITPPEDSLDQSSAMLEESRQGLSLLRQSLELLNAYIARRDEATADRAIDLARQGVERIQHVKEQTEQNIEAIVDGVDS